MFKSAILFLLLICSVDSFAKSSFFDGHEYQLFWKSEGSNLSRRIHRVNIESVNGKGACVERIEWKEIMGGRESAKVVSMDKCKILNKSFDLTRKLTVKPNGRFKPDGCKGHTFEMEYHNDRNGLIGSRGTISFHENCRCLYQVDAGNGLEIDFGIYVVDPQFCVKMTDLAQESSYYEIRPGDTGYKIAKKFSMSFGKLQGLNPDITDWTLIYPGQEIVIR